MAGALLVAVVVVATGAGDADPASGRGGPPVGDGTGGVATEPVGSFTDPVQVAFAPGAPGMAYVVEQRGTVQALAADALEGEFLDIRGRVRSGGEEGLLSIAFHPGFQTNRLLYAYYTNEAGNIEIDEFRAPTDTDALESSRRRVLVVRHPVNSNHNGGTIAFGPDRLLYAGTGDGGGAGDPPENAQDLRSLLGKLLRINPRRSGRRAYRVPRSNPYVGRRGRNEIYARGLRNPFRFTFDSATGRITIGDVGQFRFEEVDYETPQSLRAANFGWDRWEGRERYRDSGGDVAATPKRRNHDRPIHVYTHAAGNCSITGGLVVRDPGLASLYGRYLYADFCAGALRSLIPRLAGAADDKALGVSLGAMGPTSIVEDPADHTVYATNLDGTLYRLVPAP